MRLNFQAKLTMIFVSFFTLVLLATGYFIHKEVARQQKEELRAKILSFVRLTALQIDAEKLTQIKPERESEDTALYLETQSSLRRIRDLGGIIDDVYVMVKTGRANTWMFLVDSGNKKRGLMAHCGESFDITPYPKMQVAFLQPSVDTQVSSDKWGSWLSGYAPIYDKSGQAVAIAGVDVSAESIKKLEWLFTKIFLFFLILSIVCSVLLGIWIGRGITAPLRSLMAGVKEVEKGNLNIS